MRRAVMSLTPPGANGTTMRTGRVGYACAQAMRDAAGSAAAPAARCRKVRRGSFMASLSERRDASFRLDVGRPDHLAPLFGFLLKPPPVIRGRAAGAAAAQVSKPPLQFWVRPRGGDLLIQFVDDLRGRVFGCADTYPCSRIVTRHKLTQRWNIRQDLRARRSGDRQCAHFAGLDVLNG